MASSWGEACVLLVDDEADIIDAMEVELESLGCRKILKAYDGASGFHAFQANAVDIVISDIRMPRCDGIEMMKNIKRVSPDFGGLYLMTGYSDVKIEELLRLGAVAVFKKPFDVDAMVKTIEARMGQA